MSTETPKHTPPPWSVGKTLILKRGDSGPERWLFEKCWDDAQGEADAQFAVHAVNCHDDLLAALEAEQRAEDLENSATFAPGDEIELARLTARTLRAAALRKARGE